jgi:hypothetical protein
MGAILLAGILGVVVWIGISGRPAEQPTAIREPAISPPPPAVNPQPGGASAAFDRYSVVATIGHKQYIAVVIQIDQSHMSAKFAVPIPPPATDGTLELDQVWSTVSHDAWLKLAKWDLRLESLSAASGREYIVLDQSVPARRTLRNVPPPVTNGYKITVTAQSGTPSALLRVDIRVGSQSATRG